MVVKGERPSSNASNGDAEGAVLIVESESLVRSLLGDELRAQGYRVLTAERTDEAQTILRSLAQVDVVITSQRLPGTMNAARWIDWLRADQPDVKIVMISGAAPRGRPHASLDGYLAKPFLPSQLTAFLRTLLATGPNRETARSAPVSLPSI